MTLNEWFEEWFTDVKMLKVKEMSISPMRNNFKGENYSFGPLLSKNLLWMVLKSD